MHARCVGLFSFWSLMESIVFRPPLTFYQFANLLPLTPAGSINSVMIGKTMLIFLLSKCAPPHGIVIFARSLLPL